MRITRTGGIEINIGYNFLTYYKKTKKLKIALPKYQNQQTGKICNGRSVDLNLDAVRETPEAVELLKQILNDIS